MMDGDFGINLKEIKDNIDNADVLSMFFPTLRRSLVIDTRTKENHGPIVKILPMVASPHERLRSLRRLRPGFPRLQSLTLIPWLRYVDSLLTTGVWQHLVDRVTSVAPNDAGLPSACNKALVELQRLEQAELIAVIKGENYHTVWSSDR